MNDELAFDGNRSVGAASCIFRSLPAKECLPNRTSCDTASSVALELADSLLADAPFEMLPEREGGTVKSRTLTLARARELAQLVKGAPKSRKKGARKKTVRASAHVEVSQSFYERYLGHFGVGSKRTRTATSPSSRASKRSARRKKAART